MMWRFGDILTEEVRKVNKLFFEDLCPRFSFNIPESLSEIAFAEGIC